MRDQLDMFAHFIPYLLNTRTRFLGFSFCDLEF